MEREDPDDQNDKKEQPAPEPGWNWILYCFAIFFLIYSFFINQTNKPTPKDSQPTKTENLPPPTEKISNDDCDAFYEKAKDSAEYLPEISIAHSLLYQNCLARKKNQPKTHR